MSSIIHKISSLALGDLISRGLGFFTSIYLARMLGPEGYGVWTTSLAILSYLLWFSDLGIMQLGTREVAKSHLGSHTASNVYYTKLFWGLLVVVMVLIISPALDYKTEIWEISQILMLSLIPYAFHLEWLFSGKQAFGTLQTVKALQASVFFLLVVFGLSNSLMIELTAYYYGVAVTISSIVLWFIAFRKGYIQWHYPSLHSIRNILSQSLQLGVGWLATQVIILFPPLVFAYFYSEEFVGLFGAALRIVLLVMIIDRVLVQILLPNLSRMWSQSHEMIGDVLSNGFRIHSLIGLYGSLGILYLAPYLISGIYGSEYHESIPLLQMLSILIFFTFQNSIFATSLVAMDSESAYLKANVLGGSIGAVILIFAAFLFTKESQIPVLLIGLVEGIIMGFSYYYFNKALKKNSLPNLHAKLTSLYLSFAIGYGVYIGLLYVGSWSHELISMISLTLTLASTIIHNYLRRSDFTLIQKFMRYQPPEDE